jgi:hypothetical protein
VRHFYGVRLAWPRGVVPIAAICRSVATLLDKAACAGPARRHNGAMTADSTRDDAADQTPADPTYAFKPSLLGAPSVFTLAPDALHFRIGSYSGRIRYDRIRRVRLSFRPVTLQSYRFVAEIWAADNPKIQIASSSWRNVVQQERLDAAYAAFVAELHRRIAAAGGGAQFIAGMPAISYWIGAVVFGAATVAMAVLVVHAVLLKEWTGGLIVGLLFIVFGFQIGNYFRRNWPARYRPDAIPGYVLPRG